MLAPDRALAGSRRHVPGRCLTTSCAGRRAHAVAHATRTDLNTYGTGGSRPRGEGVTRRQILTQGAARAAPAHPDHAPRGPSNRSRGAPRRAHGVSRNNGGLRKPQLGPVRGVAGPTSRLRAPVPRGGEPWPQIRHVDRRRSARVDGALITRKVASPSPVLANWWLTPGGTSTPVPASSATVCWPCRNSSWPLSRKKNCRARSCTCHSSLPPHGTRSWITDSPGSSTSRQPSDPEPHP